MAFAAARMIKEKKNLEAEHKKRSSDGLSKTKSKVILPHVLTHQNHIRHPQGHITSYLDTSWHTTSHNINHTTAKCFFTIISWQCQWFHIMSMQWYHIKENVISPRIRALVSPLQALFGCKWHMKRFWDCKYNIHDIHSPINSLSFQNSIFAEHVFFHIHCVFPHQPLGYVPVNSNPIRLKAFKLITVVRRKASI